MNLNAEKLADYVLRAGVAFAFLYPPINAISNPESWLGYFPGFMRGYVPDEILLHSFGAIEVIIALWILSGWRAWIPALLATIMLVLIVAFSFYNFEVVFRDLSIAAASLALVLLHIPKRVSPTATTLTYGP